MQTKIITRPTVHLFESTSDAYDETQTRDDIRDGDVLVVESERVVGILVSAWPTAVTVERGAFHALAPDVQWHCVGQSDERSLTYTVHPPDAEPYEHTELIEADPGTDYSESEREALDVLKQWREHDERVAELSDDERAYFDAHNDERELSDDFPRYSRVIVHHAFSTRERARGEVLGYVLGWHDYGSPESGPGPVEQCELVRVRCDDDSVHNFYPGDVESERA